MKNSLEIYEELKGTNLTEHQAHAIVNVMQACVEDRVSELVTKTEFQTAFRELEARIRELEAKMEAKFRELEARLEAKIEAGRVDTLKWMSTLLMGGMTIILGAMYFMFTMFLHR